MYAIAIKQSSHSSWQMHQKVFDDREKADVVIEGMKIAIRPYKIIRVFFEEEV